MIEYIIPTIAVVTILLLLLVGWVMTLLSLPGTWLILVGAAAYAYFVPGDWRIAISWMLVAILLGLAIIGELLESLAVAVGAGKAGGSKRAAVLALVGSIAGGVLGGILGVPVPVFGPLIALLIGASFGAMAGAMLGEYWKGRSADFGWEVGKAAFWGRLLGTFAKIIVASIMVAVVLLALVIH